MTEARWAYFTHGERRTLVRATPAKVQRWSRSEGKWVDAPWRPEAVFSDFAFDPATPKDIPG
jgi:hypothetical protein